MVILEDFPVVLSAALTSVKVSECPCMYREMRVGMNSASDESSQRVAGNTICEDTCVEVAKDLGNFGKR